MQKATVTSLLLPAKLHSGVHQISPPKPMSYTGLWVRLTSRTFVFRDPKVWN
jgi:hypothetical protein